MKIKKPKKILFAAVDVGYRMEYYSKFIQNELSGSLVPESLMKYENHQKHYKTSYTYTFNFFNYPKIIQWFISFFFFLFALYKYDIFHFISGETLLTRKLRKQELYLYRMFNKKVIFHFVGSDIRNPNLLKMKNLFKKNNHIKEPLSLKWQESLIKDTLLFANSIIVSTPDLLKIIPSAVYFPVVIDFDKLSIDLSKIAKNKNNTEIKILHVPSNPSIKGSEIIYKTLNKIALESDSNIKLIIPKKNNPYSPLYTVTRQELFKYYCEADIVIDQLIIGWYGAQSIEALATKNQVICYIEPNLNKYLYPNCPIEIADKYNLEEVVNKCILKHQNKDVQYEKNKKWAMKYHSLDNNSKKLTKTWGVLK